MIDRRQAHVLQRRQVVLSGVVDDAGHAVAEGLAEQLLLLVIVVHVALDVRDELGAQRQREASGAEHRRQASRARDGRDAARDGEEISRDSHRRGDAPVQLAHVLRQGDAVGQDGQARGDLGRVRAEIQPRGGARRAQGLGDDLLPYGVLAKSDSALAASLAADAASPLATSFTALAA